MTRLKCTGWLAVATLVIAVARPAAADFGPAPLNFDPKAMGFTEPQPLAFDPTLLDFGTVPLGVPVFRDLVVKDVFALPDFGMPEPGLPVRVSGHLLPVDPDPMPANPDYTQVTWANFDGIFLVAHLGGLGPDLLTTTVELLPTTLGKHRSGVEFNVSDEVNLARPKIHWWTDFALVIPIQWVAVDPPPADALRLDKLPDAPEPASLALVALGAFPLLRRRRRSHGDPRRP